MTPLIPITGLPQRIIHLSDTHVGRRGMADALRKIVAHILAHEQPCTVCLTGDVTEDGTEAQFKEARAILSDLVSAGFLLLAVDGNHDVARGGIGFGSLLTSSATRDRFDAFLADLTGLELTTDDYPYAYDVGHDLRVIALTSCVPPVDLARGQIGYGQMMDLVAELERTRAAGRRAVVMLHHHPWYHNSTLKLADASELLHALSGRCELLLFGHKHEAGEWSGNWRIARAYAADASTRSMRYRAIEVGDRTVARWVGVKNVYRRR